MSQIQDFAVLTDNFPPCSGGGIAEWALGIAENLSSVGHRVTVLSRWKKDVPTASHLHKGYRLDCMFGRDWGKLRYWYVMYYLWRYLLKQPQAIILATTWELAEPMVFLKRFFPESKLVVIAHGREVTKLKNRSELKKFQKTIESAVITFAVSRYTKEQIEARMDGSNASVVFLPNAVDVSRFNFSENYQHIQEKLGLKPHNKVILTLARVIERKGHDTVLQAMPKIIQKFPEAIYVIAGPWKEPFYQKLQTMIEQLKLKDHVVFTSFVADEDLEKFYSMSDVYVMVSRELEESGDSEGFGITFLEANACNCPVIGSYSGGIPDAIEDGVSGFLIQPDDPETLSQKINLLFENPDLRDRIAKQGRQRVEAQFTWQKISIRMLNHIQQALEIHKN